MKKISVLILALIISIGVILSSLLPPVSLAHRPEEGRRALKSPAYDVLYSAYLGGLGSDAINAAAADANGDIYVTGQTTSDGFGAGSGVLPYPQVFVAKINHASGALDYLRFINGSQGDRGTAIAVDAAGNAYITGDTESDDFPATEGAFQTALNRRSDAFVVKLDANGNTLYATYLGGYQDDYGAGIAVDNAGNAAITGLTYSSDFTTTATAIAKTLQGGSDAFVTRLNSDGSALLYSTYLGGSSDDGGNAISVDAAGNAHVAGVSYSPDFPLSSTPLTDTLQIADAFVSKINLASGSLLYSTFLGGSDLDQGTGIAAADANTVYLTGLSYSSDFPVTANAFQTQSGGLSDAFAAKLDMSASTLLYATFLGGSRSDYGTDIAFDSAGFAYVSGAASSRNFPTSVGAYRAINSGGSDAFLVKLNPGGTGAYATYLGGENTDQASGIALGVDDAPYLVGSTKSISFPTTANAPEPAFIGVGFDAFVTGFTPITPTTSIVDAYVETTGSGAVRPGEIVNITVRYGNYGAALASSVILSVTLDSQLTYVGDTSGQGTAVFPPNTVVWSLPDLNFLDNKTFILQVQAPYAEINTRYPITFTIASNGPEGGVFPNTSIFEALLAYKTYLPLIFKNW